MCGLGDVCKRKMRGSRRRKGIWGGETMEKVRKGKKGEKKYS